MSETTKSPLLLVLIALVCVLIVLQQTGWTLKEGGQNAGNSPAPLLPIGKAPTAVDKDEDVRMSVSKDDIALLISALNPQQKQALLNNQQAFAQLVAQEAYMRALLKGAYKNKLHEDKRVSLLLERAADRMLAEQYLSLLVQNNLKDKQPSEEDIEKYYQENPGQFAVPDRIYVSQIYFSNENSASPEEAMEKARKAHQQLVSKKVTFEKLAAQVSDHASKANGGDMGPVSVNQFLPEIREVLVNMEENGVSEPVASKSGVHIVKRGGIIKSETVSLEQAREQIRNLLIRNTREGIKIAIIKRLTETYPVNVETENLEDWRTAFLQ